MRLNASQISSFCDNILSRVPFDVENFKNSHSPKQIEYFNCTDLYCMLFGGRRGGKTIANTSDSIITDKTLMPNTDARIIFASGTAEKSKDLYWNLLTRANKYGKFGWVPRMGEKKIITPSNTIVFRGLKDIQSADLDYGFKIKRLYLDEIQTIREKVLKHYLENVIPWGTAGIEGARINFTGNPPTFKMPYLEKQYKNPKYPKIHVTMFDNPSLTTKQIEELMQKNADFLGLSLEEAKRHPTFRRNVYGEWIYSNELVIFDTEKIQKYSDPLPDDLKDFYTVLGVDIGGGAAQDALVVLAWHKYRKDEIYYLEEKVLNTKDEDLETLAGWIKKYELKYEERNSPFQSISIDTGGLGERVASVLRQKYGVVNLVAAVKSDKMAYLEEMRTELYQGRFKMPAENCRLLEEMAQILYTEDYQKVDDEQGLHSDLLDAALYSFRFIYSKWPEMQPKILTHREKRREERMSRMRRRKKHGYSGEYVI